MAYAEKRSGLWRARWRAPDGTLDGKSGFRTRKEAEDYGDDQEAAIRAGTYVDPRAGRITLIDWVNRWFPALDLEPSTLDFYRHMIEVHVLPAFGERALWSLTAEDISLWEMKLAASGYSKRTAQAARSTLTTVLEDAVPRYIPANPALRKRRKGRTGQRRIERHEKASKVWATPLEALLVAERCAALSGNAADFVFVVTLAYTAMRWSEAVGLAPKLVGRAQVRVEWKLYELNGRFYRGRPKDGSIRPVDLPPFLAQLLADHVATMADRTCNCRNSTPPWCSGDRYVFLTPGGGHFRRSNYARRFLRPAADARHPDGTKHATYPVLVDTRAAFPGYPVPPWPAAVPGEEFVPPAGRGVARLVSDKDSGRCGACGRSVPRRIDGHLITHHGRDGRCAGSGQPPGEDTQLASWLPVAPGLTPHGLRHGNQTWLEEAGVPYLLVSERMGHDVPGMRGVYGHPTAAMRSALNEVLEACWATSLQERARLGARSLVPVLDALLAFQRGIGRQDRLPFGSQKRTQEGDR